MKQYIKIIGGLAFAAGLVSCTGMLDVSPDNQLASSNMWTTEGLADKGMAGLYKNFYKKDLSKIQLRHNDFDGINRQGWMGMEFQTDYTVANYPYMPLTASTKDATNFIVWYEWRWAYTSIHQINDAIANLHKAGMSTEKYERYMCEAKFLRAWFYTRLNRIYGGVPVYLEPITNEQCTKGQESAEYIWKEVVIKDLNDCIDCSNFPDNTLTANYGRPSKGAAYALRGQAYLDLGEYALAAKDFEKVEECGYGFWEGEYIDFFRHENEKNKEMIFPLQFGEDAGYCDNLQLIVGGRDSYNGWSNVHPSSAFVDYYQNADGSEFHWSDVPGLEDWDNLTESQREVFFLRDGYYPDERCKFSEAQKSSFKERIAKIGEDVFNNYYLPDGNEERIRKAYDNRDPRLKATVLTPYDPYDTFKDLKDNGGKTQIGKELRWPFFKEGDDGGDYYIGANPSMYIYKKYNCNEAGMLIDRLRCHTDWPLIRYTDVALLLAECYVQTDNLSGAIAIVNKIRERAHMGPTAAVTKDEVFEAVKYERRVELCLEGQNYFDEWRWGSFKEMKFQGKDKYSSSPWWGEWEGHGYPWYYTDDMRYWGAPAGECQRNPNLVRKPGWAY